MRSLQTLLIRQKVTFFWLLILITWLPSYIWVVVDSHIWPWDPAYYGDSALILGHDLLSGNWSNWVSNFLHTTPTKPPALVWIEQFITFILPILHSAEKCFLTIQIIIAFGCMYIGKKILDYESVNYFGSIFFALSLSSNLLFIGLSHQNFVEPIQLLSILLIIRNYQLSKEKNSSLKIQSAKLISLCALGAMTKSTSLAYELPFILLSFRNIYINRIDMKTFDSVQTPRKKLVAQISVFTAIAWVATSIMWYVVNLRNVFGHFLLAFKPGSIYSTNLSGVKQIEYWLSILFADSRITLILGFATCAVLLLIRINVILQNQMRVSIRKAHNPFLPTLTCTFLISITTTVWADNGDARFMLPAIGILTLLLSLLFSQLHMRVLQISMLLILTIGANLHQYHSLNKSADHSGVVWNNSPSKDQGDRLIVQKILESVCPNDGNGHSVMIGVDLASLNPNTLNFMNHEMSLEKKTSFYCNIFGIDYASRSLSAEMKKIEISKPKYFLTLNDRSISPSLLPNALDLNYISQSLKQNLVSSHLVTRRFVYSNNWELYSFTE